MRVGEMEIGRIPSIAPDTTATTQQNGSGARAQTVLPATQTVTSATGPDSPQLTFREVPVRQLTRDDTEPASGEEIEQPAEEKALETRLERRDREVRREIEFDRDASAVVFRAVEVSTGDVVSQFPEEARLNLRAYLDTQVEPATLETGNGVKVPRSRA